VLPQAFPAATAAARVADALNTPRSLMLVVGAGDGDAVVKVFTENESGCAVSQLLEWWHEQADEAAVDRPVAVFDVTGRQWDVLATRDPGALRAGHGEPDAMMMSVSFAPATLRRRAAAWWRRRRGRSAQ
jgi:hypothetical protein